MYSVVYNIHFLKTENSYFLDQVDKNVKRKNTALLEQTQTLT